MGHFIITLPGNSKWDVRFGYVKRKVLFINLFRKNKLHSDTKKGYIVVNKQEQKEYRLLKTLDGKWLDKEEAGFQAGNDEIGIFIKGAIDEFEKHNQHC